MSTHILNKKMLIKKTKKIKKFKKTKKIKKIVIKQLFNSLNFIQMKIILNYNENKISMFN